MSTSSTSPLSYFNGTSTYAGGLQQVISRAVQIASLPMQLLQQQQLQLTDEQSAIQTLAADTTNVQSAITELGNSTGVRSFFASVSDTSVATAGVASGVMSGTWSLHV